MQERVKEIENTCQVITGNSYYVVVLWTTKEYLIGTKCKFIILILNYRTCPELMLCK